MARGKICVSVAGVDASAVYNEVQPMLEMVDVVEVRLDLMTVPEVAECCSLIRKPLLFTNRPIWEGGRFPGFEDDRIRPLFTAVEQQADYVDFELRADPLLRSQLLEAMESAPARMIISWHDFKSTPAIEELSEILNQMIASGAHIGKIVSTAHSIADVLRMFEVQERALAAGFPLSCFCMGNLGRISRFATLYLGGYMTYGALDARQATAPGQLSVQQLYSLSREFENGRTNG
jgi:3-dehydroquinate dehydratase-1/3-dehydroquinate dehydratase/shikimate dehydrogenase